MDQTHPAMGSEAASGDTFADGFRRLLPDLIADRWRSIPNFWKFQSCIWSLYGLGTLPIHFIALYISTFWKATAPNIVLFCLVSCCFSVVITSGMREVYRRSFSKQTGWKSKLPTVLLLSAATALLKGVVLDPMLFHWFGSIQPLYNINQRFLLLDLGSFMIHLCLYSSWSALYFVVKARHLDRLLERRMRDAERQKMQMELQMLRSQIQPHFLFNALNTLACETDGNPRLEMIIQGMSEYLRYGLGTRSDPSVTLGDEIEAITQYLQVEKARYGDDIKVDLRLDPSSLQVNTPGIFIQPLIENAIKHGRTSSSVPVRIRLQTKVKMDSLLIKVANTGTWKESTGSRRQKFSGVGLENLRARLNLLYPGKHRFSIQSRGGWVIACISLDTSDVSPD